MNTPTDRMNPLTSLTRDERERARRAYEETPSLLDGPVLAALAHLDRCEQIADAIVARVRGGQP